MDEESVTLKPGKRLDMETLLSEIYRCGGKDAAFRDGDIPNTENSYNKLRTALADGLLNRKGDFGAYRLTWKGLHRIGNVEKEVEQ